MPYADSSTTKLNFRWDTKYGHTVNFEHAVTRVIVLKSSGQAASRHIGIFHLMLLGSPPDVIRELRLRKTHPSTVFDTSCRTTAALIMTSHPCYSGLQVQGTANSPASMTIFHIPSNTHAILSQSL